MTIVTAAMLSDIILGFASFFSGMGVLIALHRLTRDADHARTELSSHTHDAARTSMAVQQIRDLAESMACDVGAHQKLVAEYSEQLTLIRQNDCDHGLVFEEVLTGMLAANSKLQERLEVAEQKIKAQADQIHSQHSEARSDALTGLANRRAFDQHLADCVLRLRNESRPFSLLLLDIDNFKQFNDIHGHLAGDDVLRAVGRMLSGLVKSGDLACRYGGEEFAVIMAGSTAATSKSAADRVRVAMEGMHVQYEGLELQVTVSVGVTEGQPGESEAQVFRRADAAVYASKKAGRNRSHWQTGNTCHHIESASRAEREVKGGGRRGSDATLAGKSESLSKAAFTEVLSRRIAETHRSGASLSLLYFGIDDVAPATFTSAVALTEAVGSVIRSAIREMDSLGQLDAGEFVVMLPGSSRSAAQIVAQRVKAAVASCPAQVGNGNLMDLRLGIAELEGMDEALDLVGRAKADALVNICTA